MLKLLQPCNRKIARLGRFHALTFDQAKGDIFPDGKRIKKGGTLKNLLPPQERSVRHPGQEKLLSKRPACFELRGFWGYSDGLHAAD